MRAGGGCTNSVPEMKKCIASKPSAMSISPFASGGFFGAWGKDPATESKALVTDELKIIVFNKHDLVWAEEQAAATRPDCTLYLQPEWDKAAQVTPLIIDYIKANPQWELSLQVHKYINVP